MLEASVFFFHSYDHFSHLATAFTNMWWDLEAGLPKYCCLDLHEKQIRRWDLVHLGCHYIESDLPHSLDKKKSKIRIFPSTNYYKPSFCITSIINVTIRYKVTIFFVNIWENSIKYKYVLHTPLKRYCLRASVLVSLHLKIHAKMLENFQVKCWSFTYLLEFFF